MRKRYKETELRHATIGTLLDGQPRWTVWVQNTDTGVVTSHTDTDREKAREEAYRKQREIHGY